MLLEVDARRFQHLVKTTALCAKLQLSCNFANLEQRSYRAVLWKGMNINPKKSWHVLSRANIERVRQDEAKAKAEEEEKALRATIAECEARVELMRKRAREREGLTEEEEEEVKKRGKERATDRHQHINFFADLEQGVGLKLTNAEHEAEKKAEKEKQEKRLGILNYLVDGDKDSDPWYVKRRKTEDSKKSEQRKERMDPLKDMKHYVTAKKKSMEEPKEKPLRVEAHSYSRREEKHHKHHKHKHKSKKSDALEELRRERRRREEAERAKAEALVRRHYGAEPTVTASGPQAVEEMPGRYNSQFNPHLARH